MPLEQQSITMDNCVLPTPSEGDIDNLAEHLRGLGQGVDPDLHPDEVYIGVDDAITIIQWLSKHQHVEDLLTKCFLYPKRLSIEIEYERYVLIYHDEKDTNKDLNIMGCEAQHEEKFRALRTVTMYYAYWVRQIEQDELAARQLEQTEKS
ncbi:hypothetical protein N0V87_007544 [Didymella glomerata]|uniref:Uncharacterized protein n=1 Tax=Didymella glomerata TaxID=749621 RepID=A0A9W8WUN2_9PLEO|nr:hypothetical protein N0V87_007544 [Didymella glomerata]